MTVRCALTENTTLNYTILYYTILYYTVLYYTILYTTIYYTILHFTKPHYTTLYFTTLYCTILYCTVLHYTILYNAILYYTILSNWPLTQSRTRIHGQQNIKFWDKTTFFCFFIKRLYLRNNIFFKYFTNICIRNFVYICCFRRIPQSKFQLLSLRAWSYALKIYN